VDEALQKKVIEDGSKWKGSNFIRVVRIGKSWCCCGGTHLKNTFLLKDQLKINKITNKQKTP
jgi:alanyl-tRNA synthetase